MRGLLGVPLPGIEVGIAASAILLDAAVLFEYRPPLISWPPNPPNQGEPSIRSRM
jgi:hydrogenase/urease accessory protein HupE